MMIWKYMIKDRYESMRKNDDLVAVKKVALDLLEMEVKPTEIQHLVDHPIFENQIYTIFPNGPMDFANMKPVDLLSSEGLKEAKADKAKEIEDCADVGSVSYIIRKAYRLQFLSMIKDFLSQKTFSEELADIWVNGESPNADLIVSTDTLLEWFHIADKDVIMNEEELNVYKGLPDKVQVYRGVGEKSNPYGLSWTLSLEQARWFADRYSMLGAKGYVLIATAKKEDILAYFETEKEVIVDVSKLDVNRLEN